MKTVRIVPPEPCKGNRTPTAQGTRVLSGDGNSPEVWSDIQGVRTIDVHYGVDEIISATVELYVWPETVDAVPSFMMTHPITGERVTIDRIEFADGSEFKA